MNSWKINATAYRSGNSETAERILQFTNPWRIKVLGDNIESNEAWNAKRMKTLYEGVSAKFRQSWPLHDELIKSKGLKLYEATTDPYFGCGIGFDSKRWSTMDWTGDNVAGLVIMKVREELLHELSDSSTGDNTLTKIASERDEEEHMDVGGAGHDPTPLESTLRDDSLIGNTSRSADFSSQTPPPGKHTEEFPSPLDATRGQPSRRGHSPRGRGNTTPSQPNYTYHARGRGQRGHYRRNPSSNHRCLEDRRSQDDKDFLFGYQSCSNMDEEGHIVPSPRKKSQITCFERV